MTFTSLFRSRISGRVVKDEAQRTVKYVEYTLSVQGYIQDNNGTGTTMDSWRKLLQQPAGQLEYSTKGFGTFAINTLGGKNDCKYGPWPTLLEFVPIGSEQAASITWEVVICIHECVDGATQPFLAFNFDINWDIDRDGFTRITYSGFAEIPVTRTSAGSVRVPDTADRWRENIAAAFPMNVACRRETQNWKLSKDRRRLDFTIVDIETESPLPLDVTQADVTENMESQSMEGQSTFQIWTLTLGGSLTLKRGAPKSQAFSAMQLIIRSRVTPLISKGFAVLATGLSLRDEIFGRTAGFTARFQVIGVLSGLSAHTRGAIGDFNAVLATMAWAGELWTPLPNLSYAAWQQSIRDGGPGHPRGFLQNRHIASNDAIIDLCNDDPIRVSGGRSAPSRRLPPGFVPVGSGISPPNSWLEYENGLEYEESGGNVQHTPIGPIQQTRRPPVSIDDVRPGMEPGPIVPRLRKVTQDLDPVREFTIRGSARRVGFRIAIPVVERLGGVPVREAARRVTERVVGNIAGLPIFELTWKIRYTPDQPARQVISTQPDAIKLREGNSRYSR